MGLERRGQTIQPDRAVNVQNRSVRRNGTCEAKPFCISKELVFDSFQRVKKNQGACGVDRVSVQSFEKDLKNNLYKIWNRMSSGSYFPPPTKRVDISKADGGIRSLGIPTVGDRVAQMVVKSALEPILEPVFHPDSYGYRPSRSALDAVKQTRLRCWKMDWVIDLDIQGFFDNIPHDLLMRAVRYHTKEAWVVLYIERWLTAPVMLTNGEEQNRECGTPQGGVISPLLANLFLHYAFDRWLAEHHGDVPFERYADDAVLHCRSLAKARAVLTGISERLQSCGLTLHPQKTKIVYCKDANRRGTFEEQCFDFLGYSFRPRPSKNRDGKIFVNFTPAISGRAKKEIFAKLREKALHKRSDLSVKALAGVLNPMVRGWVTYYGAYNKSRLLFLVYHLDSLLLRWVRRKYKKQGANLKRSLNWIKRVKEHYPDLFFHWGLLRV